ncbi:MAG: phosphoserine phosphatase SerB [Arenicella sp.]
MSQVVLLNISGDDRIGLSAELYSVFQEADIRILDIGQSVIHDQVSLGMMIQLPDDVEPEQLLSDLKAKGNGLGVTIKASNVSSDSYQHWVDEQGQNRYILTLLTREVSAEEIARITQVTAEQGLNIHDIARLSGRIPLDEPVTNQTKSCIEFALKGTPKNSKAMRASFLQIASELDIDIAFQQNDAFRRTRRLVCFDMDSTLIEAEVIDELAKHAGVGDQVASITESAMRGEIDFKESFRQRMALLEGLDESVLEEIAANLPIMDGAERLMKNLRAYGFKIAILSGGFTYFGKYLQKKLGVDYVYANKLERKNGKLTGNVIKPVIDGKRKAKLLKKIAKKEGLHKRQVIAVGDGANDLPMLSAAGLGIAFRAKPLVRESAKQALSTHGLDSILYLLGFKDEDIIE